ncbi:MAG: RagB/SusD family nutrient uptake outer membrane protein, partial [Tunicatimonas sp.]|uniref:RagB/SusD family nutrient uptake outer membrane protein n=1 Tax=Tunicatimonas sp. TaxID=1940096 RepID=UPI003C70C746
MKRLLNNTLCLALALLLFGRCSEDPLDVANPNQIDAAVFFQSVSDLELSLTSVYSAMKPHDLFGADLWPKVHFGLPKTANQDWLGTDGWNQLYRNEVTTDNPLVRNFWRAFYRGIARSNDFISNANRYVEEREPSEDEVARINEMIGEASYLRGFYYFHMIRLWGEDIPARNPSALGVPLILEIAPTRDDMFVDRVTVDQIYQQVISDLEAAEAALPESWDGDNTARADAFAAKALLGKAYMNYEDYATAQGYFEEIINSGEFSLVPFEEYMGLFNGENE